MGPLSGTETNLYQYHGLLEGVKRACPSIGRGRVGRMEGTEEG